ncbi:MAG: M48 family metallopeptidase [Steroidobacteraceae bacterium]|nr:M48 family metallopeptidase [Steroidobacteraceae bacterium]
MDFFGRQAETRRLSRWLVLLFVLAVGAIVVAINLVVIVAAGILTSADGGMLADGTVRIADYPMVILASTTVVLGTIFVSSLVRTAALSAGGSAVAQSLGGTRVSPDTSDPLRRRLMNVVEEMAIASGVPVPQVFVLDREAGINAFAAGHNPANAAIAVTRGALVNLNRAELQGVIAHEFSHVLNGDMRLSTRLIGWLFGLTVVAMVARFVLRHAPRGGGGRKGGAAVGVIMAAAAIVLLLGWIGLFFGRLIQAAVSRKRESLADASAIQFTRDRDGLRGALVKIGALGVGSRFMDTDAEEVAHLLFASGVQRAFATHPPLVERIREIDPRFDPGEFEVARRRMNEERAEQVGGAGTRAEAAAKMGGLLQGAIVLAPATVAGLVANPATEHVLQAQGLLASLPDGIRLPARNPERAAALFIALALDPTRDGRDRQLAFVHQQLGGDFHDAVVELLPRVDELTAVQRMPVLLQVFATLHPLPRSERIALLKCLNGLLTREGRVSVFAWAMRKLAQVQLQDELDPRRRVVGQLTLHAARNELQVLFCVLAMHGSEDETEARRAYEAGMEELLPRVRPPFRREGHWAARLDQALTRLDALQPAGKELLVRALVRTISHDQRMTVAESELLRAICAVLHCPLPPLYAAGDDAGPARTVAWASGSEGAVRQ